MPLRSRGSWENVQVSCQIEGQEHFPNQGIGGGGHRGGLNKKKRKSKSADSLAGRKREELTEEKGAICLTYIRY